MSDPVAPVTQPLAALPPSGNRGTIVELPPSLPPVSQGDSLSGTVAARAAAGQLVVDTEAGQLILQTTLPLAENTAVTLQIQTEGPRPQVVILPELAGSGLVGAAPATTVAAAGETPVTTNITLGGLVSATAGGAVASIEGAANSLELAGGSVGGAQSAAATAGINLTAASTASGQPAIPEGTILTLRILEILPANLTAAGSSAQGTAVASGVGITSGNQATASSSAGRNEAAAATQTLEQQSISGSQKALRSTSAETLRSGGIISHATNATPRGAVVAATVLGATPSGQTVLQSDVGVLTLAAATTLPPGTGLRLDLAAISGASAGDENATSTFAQQWTGLAEALNALQREHPVEAQRLMQSVLPQPGPHLALAMLYFMSAVQSGNLRGWIGEQASQALERERRPLIERLVDDFMQMQRLATDSTTSDWRTHLIPLFAEEQLQQLRVFMRRGEPDEADEAEDAGTRFIVEVNFSRLGAFQLDGFVRRRHFDLVIRTHQELGQTIHADIDRIFSEALSSLDYSGSVRFQATEKFDLRPSEEVFGMVRGVIV